MSQVSLTLPCFGKGIKMAEFLTTQETQSELEKIIRNTKTQLVLISPYLKLSKTQLERLKDADRQKVKITIIYGKDELKSDEKEKLGQLENLALYFFDNLHAKCYFNEERMVITSMNLYDSSDEPNREMGVLVLKKEDSKIFDDAESEMKSILAASEKKTLKKSEILIQNTISGLKSVLSNAVRETPGKSYSSSQRHESKQLGFCLHCGKQIPHNLV